LIKIYPINQIPSYLGTGVLQDLGPYREDQDQPYLNSIHSGTTNLITYSQMLMTQKESYFARKVHEGNTQKQLLLRKH